MSARRSQLSIVFLVGALFLSTATAHGQSFVTTVAGTGAYGFSGDGGPAVEATLNFAQDIDVDAEGHVFFLDQNIRRVRRIDAVTGIITTAAGDGPYPVSVNGVFLGTSGIQHAIPFCCAVSHAGFILIGTSLGTLRADSPTTLSSYSAASPTDLDFDAAGNEYWTNGTLGSKTIFRRDAVTGVVTTIATARDVWRLALAANGDVFFISEDYDFETDIYLNFVERYIALTGQIVTVAGNGNYGYSGDGGPALAADIDPWDLALSPTGDLFMAGETAVRKVDLANGIITTVAGGVDAGFEGDGGLALSAKFSSIMALEFDVEGNLYVSDSGNLRIRKITGLTAPVNLPPTAAAGLDQSIHAGQTVLLDGTASFDDNTATGSLSFSWSVVSQPAGSSATLMGATTATPSFVADLPGSFVVELIVVDEQGALSAADYVEFASTNLPPTPNAGIDRIAVAGSPLELNGLASFDPEDDTLAFLWIVVSAPAGSSAELSNAATATPTLVPDVLGDYVIEMIISDGFPGLFSDFVTITAITGENYAQNVAGETAVEIATLTSGQVTTAGNQSAITNFLNQAVQALQSGNVAVARQKLQEAMNRTDGFPLRGAVDLSGPSRDWITDPIEQSIVYAQLAAALAAIT